MVGTPVLEAVDVSVSFGGVQALCGVRLALPEATIVGVIGPNGAGKTTLFDVLTGVRDPSAGRVLLDGRDITNRSSTWRARHGIRRTFQRQQVFGWLTVEENLLVPLEWRGTGGGLAADLVRWPARLRIERERRRRVKEVIRRLGLDDVATQPAALLPIGRARLVEVGRAIVDPPRVLLLDEPTSGLEDVEVESLGALVRSLAHDDGVAIGLVEHHTAFVMGLCDRITVLHLGAVLAAGEPAAVAAEQAVVEAYLG
jgi:branched-chain amino acid transport system ATP-binding protein